MMDRGRTAVHVLVSGDDDLSVNHQAAPHVGHAQSITRAVSLIRTLSGSRSVCNRVSPCRADVSSI